MVGGGLLCACRGGDRVVGNVVHRQGRGGAYYKAEVDMGAHRGSGCWWGSGVASMRGQTRHGLVGMLGAVAVCRHSTIVSGSEVVGCGWADLGVGHLGVVRGRP
jgi:hypothetical protein